MQKMWQKIKKAIKSKGLTQAEVAIALSHEKTKISKWKKAPNTMGLEDFFSLARYLNLDVVYLLDDSADEKPVDRTPSLEHRILIKIFEKSGLDIEDFLEKHFPGIYASAQAPVQPQSDRTRFPG